MRLTAAEVIRQRRSDVGTGTEGGNFLGGKFKKQYIFERRQIDVFFFAP